MHHPHHAHRFSSNAILAPSTATNSCCEDVAVAQQQIQKEIARFESVHPRIYQIYDLLHQIRAVTGAERRTELAEQIREQVINIEDAFVNSQEWTLSRAINEIRVGVIGSEDSCKNSLIHYFLTHNWNWEDAPEGGRFKKEVMVDGRSYLLLIRDEGSREPSTQFAHWIDALLIVFALESHASFSAALELHQRVLTLRPMDAHAALPMYLVGVKNMSTVGQPRAISEEDAHLAAKQHKMGHYFECPDGSSVLRMFNSVCQRVVQQRGGTASSRASTSFIGQEYGEGGGGLVGSSVPLHRHPQNNSHYHQRSISVLPINNEHQQHYHHRSRTPRGHEGQAVAAAQQQQSFYNNNNGNHFHAPPPPPAFRHLHNYASFTPNSGDGLERRRESLDSSHWTRSASTQQQHFLPSSSTFAMPSCSSMLLGGRGEQLSAISPAYSHNSLSSSHYGGNANNNNGMTSSNIAAISAPLVPPYTRSTSSLMPSGGMRPTSDPNQRQHNNILFNHQRNLPHSYDIPFGGGLGDPLLHSISTATSSSTLVVNNNNGSNNGHGTTTTTPGSTPNTQRKQHRRISNIFRKDNVQTPEDRAAKNSADINLGIGRAIPIKQGQLYKRSKNGLNKEWKKKYVCLYSDGRICYHQNLKEYMDKDSRGKEIYLGLATVRTSDRHKPKGGGNRHSLLPSSSQLPQQSQLDRSHDAASLGGDGTDRISEARSPIGGAGESDSAGADPSGTGLATSTSSSVLIGVGGDKEKEKSGKKEKNAGGNKEKKKRHAKRIGSAGKQDEDEECCEFEVVSCDQKRWEFSAATVEERDQWVASIEHEIEKCLQQQLSLKEQMNGPRNGVIAGGAHAFGQRAAGADIQALRRIPGNDRCADCGAPNPDWASINLGTLVCIECSGIHRTLGSHISKVRSLELDDWPPEHLAVMQAVGNARAARIWEHNAPLRDKPTPDAPRERKEQWVRMIYERKQYLPPVPVDRTLSQQLVEAVLSRNIEQLLTVLPRCGKNDVNTPIDVHNDRRTVVHLACDIGAPEILQLLIWYNAEVQALDEQGRSALWHAQVNGSAECASILAQAGLRSVVADQQPDSTTD